MPQFLFHFNPPGLRSLAHSVLLAAACAPALFAAPPATLSGILEDPSGAAVPGGTISLYQRASTTPQLARSSADGKFRFGGLPAGEYLLEASAAGLGMDAPVSIRLAAGEAREQIVKLAVVSSASVVTVTAANSPETVDQTSKALDSVDLAQASSQGVAMLSDALRWVPGLRISTRGGPGSFTTIETRGLRATDTAVLVDGFRLRDATGIQGDASGLLDNLFIVDASRAEVLRGSGSSLYGTNSMSGTVNLITNPGGGPAHGDLDVDGGGLGMVHSAAHLAGGWLDNRLTYSGGVVYLNETRGVENGTADRNWSGQGYLGYSLTPKMTLSVRILADSGYLQLQSSPFPATVVTPPAGGIIPAIGLSSAQLHLANLGLPFDQGNATFIPGVNDPDARANSSFSSSLFRWQYSSSPLVTWHVDYQLVETHRDDLDGPGGISYQPLFNTSDRYDGRVDTVQARVDLTPAHWLSLSGGYEFEREHYLNVSTDQNPDPAQRVNNNTADAQHDHAVFLQDQMRLFGDRLQILLSGRWQAVGLDVPQFGGGPSPYQGIRIPTPPQALTGDASIAYFLRPSSTKWRAHAGNSFRLPSLYERYGTYFYGGAFTAYGDPRLSPERAVSFDSGIDQYLFHERMKLSATYFYSHLQQVIAFDVFGTIVNPATDPYGRYGGYYNTGGGISRGAELSGEFRPSRSTSLFGSYTYTNAKDRNSEYSPDANGVAPLAMPRIFANAVTFTATQQFGRRTDAAVTFFGASDYLYPIYGSPYRFAGPRTLDFSAGYTLHPSERLTTRFYVRVANVLNQLYYEDGFLTPGRWAVAGVRLGF